ncbi:MAG: 30S ribosomal protein S17 [Candidatus Micrarchaeia archaeon]|jgi:small subunit ribosomal protein S17
MEKKSEVQKTAKVISTRGMIFAGKVVSTKAPKTAVVAIDYLRKVPKFERVEKRRTKLHVHVPDGMEVKEGDTVKFVECRKLSKTKSHVVTEVLKV